MHKIAIGIPTYHSIPTSTVASIMNLDRTGLTVTGTVITQGVYVPAAMRGIRDELLAQDDQFERLLIIEADMVLPRDALLKHARHDEPIVGSVYFMHSPPHAPIFTSPWNEQDYHRTFTYDEVQHMLDNPGTYEAMNVGFGCTSIRRDVLEDWPKDLPMFCNRQGLTADGQLVELGHDVAFGLEARRFGWKSYVDTSIVCGHLTEVQTTATDYLSFNCPDQAGKRMTHDPGTKIFSVRGTDLAATPTLA